MNIVDIHEFRKIQPRPTTAPQIKFKEAEYASLSNGLQLIVVENNKLPRVNLQLFIDHGLTKQGAKAGVVEITGQMLSTGTSSMNKSSWDEQVDFYGASVATTPIGGYASSLKKHFSSVIGLFADAILNPSFPQSEFDNIVRQYQSNIAAQKEEADAIASNVSKKVTFFHEHPYSEVVTESSLKNISLEDCINYHKVNFVPNCSYLIFEGNITLDEAVIMANTHFGSWESSNFVKQFFDNSFPIIQQDVNFVNKKGAVQSLIAITYAVNYQPYNNDMVAANLMNSILGGYFSSRLNLNLREQKGFTYGINSKLQNDENIGSFFTSVNVRNEVTGQAINEIIGEIRKLTEVKISEEELLQVKNVISGNFSRSIEDPKTIAKFALAIKKFGLPDDYFTTHLQKIASVSIEDIYNMARKYLQPDNLHIIVVGNEEEIIDQLTEIANTNPVKIYDFEGNQINS